MTVKCAHFTSILHVFQLPRVADERDYEKIQGCELHYNVTKIDKEGRRVDSACFSAKILVCLPRWYSIKD